MHVAPLARLVVQVPPVRVKSAGLVPVRLKASDDKVAEPVLLIVKLCVALLEPCSTVPKLPLPPVMGPKVPCKGVPVTLTGVTVPLSGAL